MKKKYFIKKTILSAGLILFTCFFSFAGGAPLFTQRHAIDSLFLLLKADKEDTSRVNHLNRLGYIYVTHQSPDSGLFFTENAKGLSLKLNYKKGLADSYFNRSYFYYYKADHSEAINSLKKALPLYVEEEDKKQLLMTYHQLGFMYSEQNTHLNGEALEKEENYKKLEQCMDSLPEEQKQSVMLFYLQNKCYNEIAAITGHDWNKVRSYIQNGKRNLKICIEEKNLKLD